ncbi:hypothetical protein K488DRAFT_54701 [Vararia minispora EC-137]|uniref:Uncharacterized protein n=1 Tax=Vararia minispora EC-137 TaxID=1314806 RepID=A0ACB8QEX4_9AGAM|nr:hypothetical protein K488DRAFT_54701 [Vararia minispora EC-137]
MSPSAYTSPPAPTPRQKRYGDKLSAGRKLGRHLPRIASGDAGDDWVAEDPPPPPSHAPANGTGTVLPPTTAPPPTRSRITRRLQGQLARAPAPAQPDLVSADAAAVTGLPTRLRLSRARAPLRGDAPLPSSRLTSRHGAGVGALWADAQRHLLQAYEYLCHVGEAQQWIEGCIGEELGFGVVEMEDGLRNGAVLAKLVRVFVGEGRVPRIYETPYPDFRHSDNMNYFFLFVRDPDVGLPESFIFEFTDLYNKKNLPKVIFCIHALSHLLARRGKAQRIGNLLGQLQFSDAQLEKTQKGLRDAGVAMPNFGNVGKTLAIEMAEEVEEEEESEEERRDRLLLENEASIVELQSVLRASLVRKAEQTRRGELRLAERYIRRLQAQTRGVLARSRISASRRAYADASIRAQAGARSFATALQAIARGLLVRYRIAARLAHIDAHVPAFVGFQAHARGALVRARLAKLKGALAKATLATVVTKLQAQGRARIVQRYRRELAKVYAAPAVSRTVARIQAAARGVLTRRRVARQLALVDGMEPTFVAIQAQMRGILVRRRVGKQLARLDDVTDIVVRIQAFFRSYLARKRLLALIRALRRATPVLVQIQARARANLARQRHAAVSKALARAEVVVAVGGFQARARAAIARTRRREQSKRLEFAAPDVRGLQAACRGALLRREWVAWRDHVRRSEHVAVRLQALLRGVAQRRTFEAKMRHYRENMDKVVKIQSLFRAKETRDQYRQLTLGTNVTVGTIKNFVHLLDDSEADFAEEVDLERMRKDVVGLIRENQALERDVSELDVKIALVVNNAKTFEELKEARRRYGADSAAVHAARASVLAAHGDPFAGPSTLDRGAQRKRELYQQLFYLLQSHGEYLGRLFRHMSSDGVAEKDRRLLERVVLTLFGYGHDRREDFLLLKVFQYAIAEEVGHARTVEDVLRGPRVWINVALHYLRQKQSSHLKEALQPILRDILKEENLDMEVDPTVIYRVRMEQHEMRLGHAVPADQKNVTFHEALADLSTRAEYIRHLQILRWWTEVFINAIVESTRRMPYAIRFLAREMLAALQAKFPDASPAHAACLGRLVYYRYINPAVITPETFNIVTNTLDIGTRRNLAQVSKVITQIMSGVEFDKVQGQNYIAINEYVLKAIKQTSPWVLEVANVSDLETQYHAHDFLDATVQPKPIYISPNEVYAMHGLLAQYLDKLAPERDDPLRVIIHELDGVPNLGSAELNDARDRAITLELTNRFAAVKDPRAEEKTLWIQAKRTVLAILRVQPGKDLVESLMQPVTDDHEELWEEVLENEMEADSRMQHPRRMPSAMGQESAYRLEDIRQLSFREVKAHAIYFLLELEKKGMVTRADGYQGILNAIANDVRSKHRMRMQRQQEIDGMAEAIRNLSERKKHFLEQIKDYNDYVEQSMATMQRGKHKKRLVLPFSKQFFHQRDLAKAGTTPQFGSFKYSAADLYDRSILISIDGFSPIQFNKIDVVISSDKLGVFTIEVFNGTMGAGMVSHIGKDDVKMQDLLQLQFESKSALSLFNDTVKFNLDLLLYQINKKCVFRSCIHLSVVAPLTVPAQILCII